MGKKLYYKIGEACRKLDIQPYVLRYWETEFAMLSPEKSRSGQRVYSEEDLTVIHRIKELLYDEGYTIAGAKKKLEADFAGGGEAVETEAAPVDERKARAAARKAAKTGAGAAAARQLPLVGGEAGASLDTGGPEQIESLRAAVRELLAEARELLNRLGPPQAGG